MIHADGVSARRAADASGRLRIWDTSAVAARERFDYWRDTICDCVLRMPTERRDAGTFMGRLESSSLGDLILNRARAGGHINIYSRREIARADGEYIYAWLQRNTSTGAISQDGRDAVPNNGDLVLIDSTRPFTIDFPSGVDCLSIKIPPALILPMLGTNARSVTSMAIPAEAPVVRLIDAFVSALPQDTLSVQEDTAAQLAMQLASLIALAVSASPVGKIGSQEARRSAMLTMIRSYIRAHLKEPLSPGLVAHRFHISTRQLHKLFERSGTTFGRHVLAERLIRCRRDLTSLAGRSRTIGGIAFDWGFNELSHFTRVFRKTYGLSPREIRALAQREVF